jgi:hypothetical protein
VGRRRLVDYLLTWSLVVQSLWWPGRTGSGPITIFFLTLFMRRLFAQWTWIKTPQVKAALHVAPDAFFFSGDNGVGFNYTLTETNLVNKLKKVHKEI